MLCSISTSAAMKSVRALYSQAHTSSGGAGLEERPRSRAARSTEWVQPGRRQLGAGDDFDLGGHEEGAEGTVGGDGAPVGRERRLPTRRAGRVAVAVGGAIGLRAVEVDGLGVEGGDYGANSFSRWVWLMVSMGNGKG